MIIIIIINDNEYDDNELTMKKKNIKVGVL